MAFRDLQDQIDALNRKFSGFSSFINKAVPTRGTTAERDEYFGIPSTNAERVALANRALTWYNTDLGWQESYYATTGLPGLTVPGLVDPIASGWYPTGAGPRAQVFAAGAQTRTAGTKFTNYFQFGANLKSYRNGGSSFFDRVAGGGDLIMKVAGRYRIKATLGLQNGTGTGVFSLRTHRANNSVYINSAQPATLMGSYGQMVWWDLPESTFLAGDYASMWVDNGSLQVGQGETYLSVEYVGPGIAST